MMDIIVFLLGVLIVLFTLDSAIRTFVLPRRQNVFLTALVFRGLRLVVVALEKMVRSPARVEGLWAMYAPVALILLPIFWLLLMSIGFACMFWAIGVQPWQAAFLLAGSSLLTLGFAPVEGMVQTILSFLDASLGLILIALLIAYLPTMYSAFSRRETLVAKLEIYAGTPPSPIEIISRMHRINGINYLRELYSLWETWFAEVEEAHTSFAPLNYFRSPKPTRHWITAAGAVLDSAALTLSSLDIPREPRAALCIRAGYLALRHIADFFGVEFDSDPDPDDPILVTKDEFFNALHVLERQNVPLKTDWDDAWRNYRGWRVNYDTVLVALATHLKAPSGLWSSDRLKN